MQRAEHRFLPAPGTRRRLPRNNFSAVSCPRSFLLRSYLGMSSKQSAFRPLSQESSLYEAQAAESDVPVSLGEGWGEGKVIGGTHTGTTGWPPGILVRRSRQKHRQQLILLPLRDPGRLSPTWATRYFRRFTPGHSLKEIGTVAVPKHGALRCRFTHPTIEPQLNKRWDLPRLETAVCQFD